MLRGPVGNTLFVLRRYNCGRPMAVTAGTRLGPYKILAPLGAGGMGEGYRARETRLDRTVTIKILSATFAGEADRLDRLEHEARLLSTVNHPNLLAIHDVGAQHGVHYLVSEFLEGQTVREKMSTSPLSQRRFLKNERQGSSTTIQAVAGRM